MACPPQNPEPRTPEWEALVDLGKARHGTMICTDRVAERLGLKRTQIPVETLPDNLPAELTVWNPDIGSALHSTLVVSAQKSSWTMVNFRWKTGPVVETIDLSQVDMPDPGNPNRRCWRIDRA